MSILGNENISGFEVLGGGLPAFILPSAGLFSVLKYLPSCWIQIPMAGECVGWVFWVPGRGGWGVCTNRLICTLSECPSLSCSLISWEKVCSCRAAHTQTPCTCTHLRMLAARAHTHTHTHTHTHSLKLCYFNCIQSSLTCIHTIKPDGLIILHA